MDYKNDENYKEAMAKIEAFDESKKRLFQFYSTLMVGQEVNEDLKNRLDSIVKDLIKTSTSLEVYTQCLAIDFYNYRQAVKDLKKIPVIKGIVEKKERGL